MWRIVNMGLMQLLIGRYSTPNVAAAVVRVALALSLLRLGTLILVRAEGKDRPKGGRIDVSPIGERLRAALKNRNMADLVAAGGGLNVFASDGITVINKEGKIEDTGCIVRNANMDPHQAGGARTAAARAASKFGLVVKVSADGPISIFEGGKIIYDTC